MKPKNRLMRSEDVHMFKLFKVLAVQHMISVGLRTSSGRFEKLSLTKACFKCRIAISTYHRWAGQYESEGLLGLMDSRTNLYRDCVEWYRNRGEL